MDHGPYRDEFQRLETRRVSLSILLRLRPPGASYKHYQISAKTRSCRCYRTYRVDLGAMMS